MVAYTSHALARGLVLRGKTGLAGNSLWLTLPQLFGLLVGGVSLKPLFKRFNIRTIVVTGTACAALVISFLCALDKITHSSQPLSLGLYLPLNFLFGLSISFIPSVVSTYLGTNFSGKKANQYVSAVNGLYGLGGGIIPLIVAAPVFKVVKDTESFDAVRYFFFIALAFCVLCAVAGAMLNYRFTQDTKSDLSTTTKDTPESRKLLWKLGALIAACFFFYLIFESGANYGLSSKYVDDFDGFRREQKITLVRGLGLFFVVQGLWRAGSPFLFKKVKFRYFILFSAFFVAIGYGGLASQLLTKHVTLVYLVAVLLGIGIGNIWPVTFSFAQGALESKRSTMAIIANMVTFIELPVATAIVSFSLTGNHSARVAFAVVCTVLPFLIFGVMTLLIQVLKRHKLTHSDEQK